MAALRIFPLLLLACLAGCEPAPPKQSLDADALHSQVRQLTALAAEAIVFTDELAAGHLSASYAYVQQQALGSEAQRIASELTQPALPQLQVAQRQALQIAGALALQLTQVASASEQPRRLASLRDAFATLRNDARSLQGPQ